MSILNILWIKRQNTIILTPEGKNYSFSYANKLTVGEMYLSSIILAMLISLGQKKKKKNRCGRSWWPLVWWSLVLKYFIQLRLEWLLDYHLFTLWLTSFRNFLFRREVLKLSSISTFVGFYKRKTDILIFLLWISSELNIFKR